MKMTNMLPWMFAAVLLMFSTVASEAGILPFETDEIGQYIIIGMTDGAKADAVDIDDGEIGAHKAGAPFDEGFTSPSSTFPGQLIGNVPDIPLHALPVFGGIDHSGNIAITDPTGDFNFNNVGVYANWGVRSADTAANADDSGDNYFYYNTSFTDDPNNPSDGQYGFPNSLDSFGLANPGVNNNTEATGTSFSTSDIPSNFDMGDGNGLTGNHDFSALNAEISAAKAAIPSLSSGDLDGMGNPIHFASIDLGPGFSDGAIDKSMHPSDKGFGVSGPITAVADSASDGGSFTVTLQNSGLTVIDFEVDSGKDVVVSNYNFVVDGPEGAIALFRVPDDSTLITSQANILAGTGGIGENGIIFATLNETEEAHFNFSNSVLNGVAFWSLTMVDGQIVHNNTQGCAQFIGDIINMNDVRFVFCSAAIPEPTTLVMLGFGSLMIFRRRRSLI